MIAEWSKINKRSPVPEISSTIIFISVMTPEGFVEGKHGVFPHTSQCRTLLFAAIKTQNIPSFPSWKAAFEDETNTAKYSILAWLLSWAVEQLEPLWNSSEKLSKIDVDFWLMLMHNIELFWISLASHLSNRARSQCLWKTWIHVNTKLSECAKQLVPGTVEPAPRPRLLLPPSWPRAEQKKTWNFYGKCAGNPWKTWIDIVHPPKLCLSKKLQVS